MVTYRLYTMIWGVVNYISIVNLIFLYIDQAGVYILRIQALGRSIPIARNHAGSLSVAKSAK